MSESEIATLRRDIESLRTDLNGKIDRLKDEIKLQQEKDRETFRASLAIMQQTFSDAMQHQRNAFQESINRQFEMHTTLREDVGKANTLLKVCIGSGEPGEGRVGALENSMEIMKRFRWQALAILAVFMWVIEVYRDTHVH